ncbi:uncharacterized protein LOC116396347 [Xyrichtys novacula]|uniref:ribonuclease H n=1 Tax=Xyrichtys novacula TaxID=13765 RepID=A0AAV1GC07_XYRNO|nr:uncharacterized protein LOC116396347 [Xyrichtys novacula]
MAFPLDWIMKQKIQESDLSPDGKVWLKQIIGEAEVARFKYDCGDLGVEQAHSIRGEVHEWVEQNCFYPEAYAEIHEILKKLIYLRIIRREYRPITNSPIMAIEEPESAGGGWRPVMNFKALNWETEDYEVITGDAQSRLRALKIKKFKSRIELENAIFSIRLTNSSQRKTAFTFSGKTYVWRRLPEGYKNSTKVLHSAVKNILYGLGATIFISSVYITDDTEEEHLQRLQTITQRLREAGLKLNLGKCHFGQFQVDYLGFQVSTDLGISDRYWEKLEKISPPTSKKDLQKILGSCNYVRDHVPNYQKYAKPLYDRLKKTRGAQNWPWKWTAADQSNLNELKKAIHAAERLEPRDCTIRLVAEISCEDQDAVVKVSNEGAGTVSWWSHTLTMVEEKFPPEEKELAVLQKYWGRLRMLAKGQGVKVITQSKIHQSLRKDMVIKTQATKQRWRKWEEILQDSELMLNPLEPWKSLCMDVVGPLQPTGKRGEEYLFVLVDLVSEYVCLHPDREADGSSAVAMLDQACIYQGMPKELWTDKSTPLCNTQVDYWCQQHRVTRSYFPSYMTQAKQVLEKTIELVKNTIAENSNSKEWSTKVLEIGMVLNNRRRGNRPSPSMELNSRPF